MANQKNPAPAADTKAKAELTEAQLKDISGGPIYMDRLYSTQTQTTDKANLSPTTTAKS